MYIFIHFELEKEIGKILILKKHAETLCSILNPSYPILTDTLQEHPHEKINRCLTDINRCLTDIFKI